MPAVGRPGWEIVAPRIMGELRPALTGDVHEVDIAPAGRSGAIAAIPRKDEELAVRRPGGRGGVTSIGHPLDIAAISIGDIDLRQTRASTGPGNLCAGL